MRRASGSPTDNKSASHSPRRNHRKAKQPSATRQSYNHSNAFQNQRPFENQKSTSSLLVWLVRSEHHQLFPRKQGPVSSIVATLSVQTGQLSSFCRNLGEFHGLSLSKVMVRNPVDCQNCVYYFRSVVLSQGTLLPRGPWWHCMKTFPTGI